MKCVAMDSGETCQASRVGSPAFLGGSLFESLAHRCLPVRVCKKGTWLVTQGDRMENLFIVQEGRVLLTRLSQSGRETILDFADPGDFFGEVPLLNGGEAPYNALSLTRTLLLVVRRKDFEALLREPGSAQTLLKVMAGRCHRAWEQVELLGSNSLPERLEASILRLCQRSGLRTPEGIEVQVNQSQLAAMIGVTRESLNRQLRALRERSILRVKRAAGMTYLVVVAPEELCQEQ